MNKKQILFITLILLLAIGSNYVFGAPDNVLEPVLDTLESFRIAENYDRYHLVVDFFIYLIIFIGLARSTLGKKLGNGPAAGIGIALSLSLTSFEYKQGFSITNFGLFAAIILMFFLGIYLYKLFKTANSNSSTAFALSFVVVYLLLQQPLLTILEQYPTLYGIFSLIFVLCMIKVIIAAFGIFSGTSFGTGVGSGDTGTTQTAEQKKAQAETRKEKKEAETTAKLAQKDEVSAHAFTKGIEELEKEIEQLGEIGARIDKKMLLDTQEEINIVTKIQNLLKRVYNTRDTMAQVEKQLGRSTEVSDELLETSKNYFEGARNLITEIHDLLAKLREKFQEKFNVINKELSVIEKSQKIATTLESLFVKRRDAALAIRKHVDELEIEISHADRNIDTEYNDPASTNDRKTILKQQKDKLKALKSRIKTQLNPLTEDYFNKCEFGATAINATTPKSGDYDVNPYRSTTDPRLATLYRATPPIPYGDTVNIRRFVGWQITYCDDLLKRVRDFLNISTWSKGKSNLGRFDLRYINDKLTQIRGNLEKELALVTQHLKHLISLLQKEKKLVEKQEELDSVNSKINDLTEEISVGIKEALSS